jgi:hypothetical protein
MSLPAAVLHPASLLLPGACLFVSAFPRLLPARILLPLWLRLAPAGILPCWLVLWLVLPAGILPLWFPPRLLHVGVLPLCFPLRLLRARILLFWLLPAGILPYWLPFRLLPARILRFCRLLRLSLLGGVDALLGLLDRLLFRLILLFVLLVTLRVCRSNGPDDQDERRVPEDGNAFHRK